VADLIITLSCRGDVWLSRLQHRSASLETLSLSYSACFNLSKTDCVLEMSIFSIRSTLNNSGKERTSTACSSGERGVRGGVVLVVTWEDGEESLSLSQEDDEDNGAFWSGRCCNILGSTTADCTKGDLGYL
jgi:hypothetical protein